MISFIWAEDEHGLIGVDGHLPWHLPNDMAFFKRTTMGHPIVAGSRTFRTFGRALPGRQNIVLSRHGDFSDDVLVVSSISQLCELVEANPTTNYFIVGGANLFGQLVDRVDRLYRTKVHHVFTGDTYMPELDYQQFKLTSTTAGLVDEKNLYAHTFEVFDRIN